MRVSVVVPTRDRPTRLAACLAALAAQTHAPAEIVVVDDRSQNPDRIAAIVSRARGARLVAGDGRGPAAARNIGVSAAHSDVICFTDDDCRPSAGWIAALTECVRTGAAVVAGATLPSPPGAVATRASQVITNHLLIASLDPEHQTVEFAPTCNLACRSETATAFPFDESFPLAAGEDREWCGRLADAGVEIVYAPDATVAHRPELTLRSFWRQQVRYGRGAAHWRRRRTGEPNLQPTRFYIDLLRAGFSGGVRCGTLVVAAQLATAYGLLSASRPSRPR